MANSKFLPSERSRPAVQRRASVLVDAAWPMVARRREISERLLSATCPHGPQPTLQFDRADLSILLLMTAERFGGAQALLRNLAVGALGTIPEEPARQRLSALALDPLEHDGVRIAAIGALGARGRDVVERLTDDLSATVRDYARRLTGAAPPKCHKGPSRLPTDKTGIDPRECCVKVC